MASGPSSVVRRVAAVVAAAGAASLGALILGEYELAGFTGSVSGVLFGLAIAEVTVTVGRDPRFGMALVAAALAAAGMTWAAWISSGRGVAPVPAGAWIGAALAGAVAFSWVRWSGKPAPGTPAGS